MAEPAHNTTHRHVSRIASASAAACMSEGRQTLVQMSVRAMRASGAVCKFDGVYWLHWSQ